MKFNKRKRENYMTNNLGLVADIGGTNARFGIYHKDTGEIIEQKTLATKDYKNLSDALEEYKSLIECPMPRHGVIDVACPVISDEISFTNNHWSFKVSAIKEEFNFLNFNVINDFTALALSIPKLDDNEFKTIKTGKRNLKGAIGLIGAGTGLGVSGLIPNMVDNSWMPLSGEGGHASFVPYSNFEMALVDSTKKILKLNHLSDERYISGSGLVNLYNAIVDVNGFSNIPTYAEPKDIVEQALNNQDNICTQAIILMLNFLGRSASNLALRIGAWSGVYIGGGVVPRVEQFIAQSDFISNFTQKGRQSELLDDVPIYLITNGLKALDGCSSLLEKFLED